MQFFCIFTHFLCQVNFSTFVIEQVIIDEIHEFFQMGAIVDVKDKVALEEKVKCFQKAKVGRKLTNKKNEMKLVCLDQ